MHISLMFTAYAGHVCAAHRQQLWDEHMQHQHAKHIIDEARDAVGLAIEATREPAA